MNPEKSKHDQMQSILNYLINLQCPLININHKDGSITVLPYEFSEKLKFKFKFKAEISNEDYICVPLYCYNGGESDVCVIIEFNGTDYVFCKVDDEANADEILCSDLVKIETLDDLQIIARYLVGSTVIHEDCIHRYYGKYICSRGNGPGRREHKQ